jgi:hypothetical protein
MAQILNSFEIQKAITLASKINEDQVRPLNKKKAGADSGEAADSESFEGRGRTLEDLIKRMCQRSNFSGAVVTDDSGYPLAVVNPPVTSDALPAFSSALGQALKRGGELLKHDRAEYLSLDINYEEKIVLRRFAIQESHYLLLVSCSQDVDYRSEIEVSIEQIIAALSAQTKRK